MRRIALNQCEADRDSVHIALLGDSTLDNGRHLNSALGELSVGRQLSQRCNARNWKVTMLAQDGSLLEDVLTQQIPLIPMDASHVVVSCSGNDLLALLNEMVVAKFALSSVYRAVGEGLSMVSEQYRELITQLKKLECFVACCTVYRPNFDAIGFKSLATISLGVHNSRLMRIAEDLNCSVLDLASIFEGDEDFANPLELSTRGGMKVVENVMHFVSEHPPGLRHTALAEKTTRSLDLASCGSLPSCCRSTEPARSIYASKVVPLIAPHIHTNETSIGEESRTPLSFSLAQQAWREVSTR